MNPVRPEPFLESFWTHLCTKSLYQIIIKKKEKDQRRLLAVLLLPEALLVVLLLLEAFLVVLLLLVLPAEARRLRLVPAFFPAAAFAAAFLFRVRAAFLAAALRFAFDAAMHGKHV